MGDTDISGPLVRSGIESMYEGEFESVEIHDSIPHEVAAH